MYHRHVCVACGRVIAAGEFDCGIADDHDCGLCLRCQQVRPGEFHVIDDDRLAAVVELVQAEVPGVTTGEVRRACVAEEPMGPDYQQWLDSADLAEVAGWVAQGIRLGSG